MTEGSFEDRGPGSAVPEAPSGPPFPAGPARTEPPWRAASVLPHVVSAALIVYLTYFFTMFFSSRTPAPAAIAEDARAAAKKIEERQAEDRKLLSNYGPVDPATQTLRIPIDRAMELLVAEGHQSPPATATAPTTIASATAPKPGAATAPGQPAATATAAVSAPPPATGGMSPTQLYHAVCIACHGADGRGTAVRQAMPLIPDFTNPKWEASRTDADLRHSILHGKGPLMLAMKDKLALAHTDVNAMLSLVRSFQSGHPAVAAGPKPAVPAPAVAAGPKPAVPAPAVAAGPKPAVPAPAVAAVPAPQPAATTAKLRASAELFRTDCIVCHGPDGRGTTVRAAMPPIPDFTTREFQSTHNPAQLSVSILEGKGTLMPPWHGKISPEQARDLVAYVRRFGPADLLTAETPANEFGTRYRALKKRWDDLERQARALSRP